MSAQFASWLFSLLPALLAWWSARRAGFDRLRAFCFAAACFPTPLFYALGGRSSFVYAGDLAMPIALVLAAQAWPAAPVRFRRALICILFGAGVSPLLGTLFTWPDTAPALQNGANAMRMVNVAALGVAFSVGAAQREEATRRLLLPFAALAMIIAVAMALQATGTLNTNVLFAELDPNDAASLAGARLDQRLAVLGMFRGSIGVACFVAVAAWLGGPKSRTLGVGALAAVLATTLIASKTTLLAMLLLVVIKIPLAGGSARSAAMTCLAILPLTALPFVLQAEDVANLHAILEVLGTSVDNLSTGTGRTDIWANTLADLAADPWRWLGVATHGQLQASIGVYHNEWLGVLMTGGVLGVSSLFVGVLMLGTSLWRGGPARWTPLQRVALLVFVGMQVQALSVAHLQPNLYFLPVAAPMMILYALAVRQARPALARTEA